jgi:hypothetical protein
LAHVKSPKRQSKTVGLARLAEELRYEWARKHPRRAPAPDPRSANPDRAERKRGAGCHSTGGVTQSAPVALLPPHTGDQIRDRVRGTVQLPLGNAMDLAVVSVLGDLVD